MARNPGRTVYIGNLDEKVSERVLYEILIQAGHVIDLHIPCDKENNRLKGYAFAEYETEEIAHGACTHKNTCSCVSTERARPRADLSQELSLVEPMEVQEAGGGDVPGAEEGVDDVFFCVAATSRGDKNNISYFHTNAVGEDAESALALAALCLDHAPEHHRWHHHTVAGARTFAFLSADNGRTYFAAADPTPGAAEVVSFLERVRDAFDAAPRKRLRDESVAPVARQFAQLLRAVAGASSGAGGAAALPGASPRARLPPTPLAAVYAADAGGDKDEEHQRAGAQRRAVHPDRESARPVWRWRSWWRHAVVVIGVDVVLCLVLFAVWMGVCKGFRCLTR
ncbi:hypothetical protein BAE44_0025126 [Dichanthelium oligosanthes]|uniref:RRM domain-containing protein n=1 Tax=Dichanthelium oligosanthes TaxID=888268 RepID=A0A1E5ULV1_9POAL|nr:hypothetical protein BAE44_0025126 [Dichanthelium oligosanthes]